MAETLREMTGAIGPDALKLFGIPQVEGEDGEGEGEEAPPPELWQLERPILLGLIVETYDGQIENHLYAGQGEAHFLGGNAYEGTFVAGRMHGKGKYFWTTGIEYEGDFAENVIRGQGVFRWPNGCVYEGEVGDGLRSGFGTLKHESSGVSYSGNWLAGKKHGKGRMDYDVDGRSYYEGDWYENLKHGWGTRQYESGNVYEGMWYKHQRQGEGKMIWKDRKGGQEIYIGQWEAGVQHGKGKHVWFYKRVPSSQYPIRNCYEGEFINGARNGQGMFFYASGAIYDGCWKDNLKHGPGKFVFKNGRIYEGIFEYDHMVEHPDLVLERLSTPELSKIRTRSPTQAESELYQSRTMSVNTLSPSFKVDLSSFEDKFESAEELPDQLEQVQRVIMHHVTPLRKIYNKYATLGNEASPDNTYPLTRMQFWRLLKDSELHSSDLTLCMMDRALAGGATGLSVHDPFKKIVFREFVHFLLSLAHLVYKKEVSEMKGSVLANALNMLVEQRLLIRACKVKGHLFGDDRRAAVAMQYATETYKIYAFFCDPKRNPKFRDRTLRQRDFMFMMKNLHLIDEHITAQALIGLMAADDPDILDVETGNFSLEAEMTFLEFFETLVGASQLAPLDHLGKKAAKSAFAFSGRASYMEEEEEAERGGSASHPSGEGAGERSGSQTGSQAEGNGEEDKDSGGTGGETGEGAANEGGTGAASGSRAGTGTPGGVETDGAHAGAALSPEQLKKLEGDSAHSQDGARSPTGEGTNAAADSPNKLKTPSRRSRTVVSSQAGDDINSQLQVGDAPSPHASAMGLMEQILHTAEEDDEKLAERIISPEEAEFQEWCSKLRKFFDVIFLPAAEQYKKICISCFDRVGNNFLNVDIKAAVEERLALDRAATEDFEDEGEEEEIGAEDPETRRTSFKTPASGAVNGNGVA